MAFKFKAAALAILAAHAAHAAEFKQVLDLQAAGGYSALQGGPGSLGIPGHLLYVPMFKLSQGEYLMPIVFVDHTQHSPKILEDTFSVESMVFMFKPTWKHVDEGGNEASVYANAKRTVEKESEDQAWSSGLYDYEEFGGGLSYSRAHLLGLPSLGLEFSLNHRSYQNYHNASAQKLGLTTNYYLKDMNIPKVDLDVTIAESKEGSLKLAYSLAFRNYTDAYLYIEGQGNQVSQSDKRRDYYHLLEFKAKKTGRYLSHGLDFSADYNDSSGNYFDSYQLAYFGDFYSFYSFSLRPNVSWLIQGRSDGHRVGLSYEAVLRNYVHRSIRNSDATVTQGAQADVEHNFALNGTYVFNTWLYLFSNLNYSVVRSNQGYEPAIKFSYDLFSAQLGLGVRI